MKAKVVGIGLLLMIGLGLRLNGYTQNPQFGSNRDELAWAWDGQSLIETHIPASWSYLPEKLPVTGQITSDGTVLPLVTPWFDHPPVFALLVGAAAVAAGQKTAESVNASAIRLVPILLSLLTALLAFLLARRRLGELVAWITLVLLCVTPWVVEASRLVESEWLLAPILLGALLLVDRKGRWQTAGLIALCVLAPMVKVPGVAVGVACALICLTERRWLAGLATGAGAAAGVGLFALYGWIINWHQFVITWAAHANLHATTFLQALGVGQAFLVGSAASLGRIPADSGPFLAFGDPLWIIGVLGLGLLALRAPLSPIVICFVVFALVIAVTADPVWSPHYAWYRFPVYGLAFMGVADLIARAIPNRNQVRKAELFWATRVREWAPSLSRFFGWSLR